MRRVQVRREGPWSETELAPSALARLTPEQRERLRVLTAEWPGEPDECRGGFWKVPTAALEELCELLDVAEGAH